MCKSQVEVVGSFSLGVSKKINLGVFPNPSVGMALAPVKNTRTSVKVQLLSPPIEKCNHNTHIQLLCVI